MSESLKVINATPADISTELDSLSSPKVPPSGCSSATRKKSIEVGTKILGYNVLFPNGKLPFPAQKAVIAKALVALSKGQHALLESPTGTGKTLALLTSTLCWQHAKYQLDTEAYDGEYREYISSVENFLAGYEREDLPVIDNPLATQTTPINQINRHKSVSHKRSSLTQDSSSTPMDSALTTALPPNLPKHRKIFYCSRTHSQLTQVIEELRNCHMEYSSDIKMCLLGSRSQLCVNHDMKTRAIKSKGASTLDELCRESFKQDNPNTCPYSYDNKVRRVADALHAKGIWDIEDATFIGQKQRGCSYFASRSTLASAQIVFAPYNYILNPGIREQLQIDLTDTVVIFDEAHNIDDVARGASSAELSEPTLLIALKQLKVLQENASMAFKSLFALLINVQQWFQETVALLQSSSSGGFHQRGNVDDNPEVWRGIEAVEILKERFQVDITTLEIYEEHFKSVMSEQEDAAMVARSTTGQDDDSSEEADTSSTAVNQKAMVLKYEEDGIAEDDETLRDEEEKKKERKITLSSGTQFVLKSLLAVFRLMLQNNCADASDFRMVIRKGDNFNNYTNTLCFWCLNANIAFRELDTKCNSVLLTSGTLSPLDAFAGDLGMSFPINVEANHVINMERQIHVTAVSSIQDVPISCTYRHQDSTALQDALGQSLRTISRLTPGGLLMFFPSYSMMDKVLTRWKLTGMFANIEGPPLPVDKDSKKGVRNNQPRSRSSFKFGRVQSFNQFPIFVEPRDAKSLDEVLQDYYSAIKSPGGRAILLAVARGKVSEGIDFKDDFARTVIIVGLPFPNVGDIHVNLIRQYHNDKSLVNPVISTGNKWFSQQAFRAINQAVGRCIRHRNDFGAIYLFDARFAIEENIVQLSRWIRSSVRVVDKLEDSILSLQGFFLSVGSDFLDKNRFNEYFNPTAVAKESAQAAATIVNVNEDEDEKKSDREEGYDEDEDLQVHISAIDSSETMTKQNVNKRERKRKPRLSREERKRIKKRSSSSGPASGEQQCHNDSEGVLTSLAVTQTVQHSAIGRAFARGIPLNHGQDINARISSEMSPIMARVPESMSMADKMERIMKQDRERYGDHTHSSEESEKGSEKESDSEELSDYAYDTLVRKINGKYSATGFPPHLFLVEGLELTMKEDRIKNGNYIMTDESEESEDAYEIAVVEDSHVAALNSPIPPIEDKSVSHGNLDINLMSLGHSLLCSSTDKSTLDIICGILFPISNTSQAGQDSARDDYHDHRKSESRFDLTLQKIPLALSAISDSIFASTWNMLHAWMAAKLTIPQSNQLLQYLRLHPETALQVVPRDNSSSTAILLEDDRMFSEGSVELLNFIDAWDADDGVVYRKYVLCIDDSNSSSSKGTTRNTVIAVKIIAVQERSMDYLNQLWLHPAMGQLFHLFACYKEQEEEPLASGKSQANVAHENKGSSVSSLPTKQAVKREAMASFMPLTAHEKMLQKFTQQHSWRLAKKK